MDASRNKNQLIPPPDGSEETLKRMSPDECIRAMVKLIDEEDAQLRAKLQAIVGPNRSIQRLYRIFRDIMQNESDLAKEYMLRELSRREHARQIREQGEQLPLASKHEESDSHRDA